jgi:ABC-2 type transport system permease protein
MGRYLKVLSLFWKTAIAAELEYRINFLLAALSSGGNLLGSLFALSLFYRGDYRFAGWSWDEALLLLGVFTLLQGFSATVLVPNLNRIVEQVQQGTLDFVLLKPISSQFWLSLRSCSPWGLPDVLLGLGLIVWSGRHLGLGPLNYLAGALPLVLAGLILYSLWFVMGTLSIWFVKIYNVTEVLRGLVEAGRYPIGAYPAAFRFFFTFVVPVAFLTTVPAEQLLQRGGQVGLLGAALLALGLLVFANRFWRFALRFYTSASS